MKKLLSLLSVLTITGTAMPTTIAMSPYQKEEIKLENNEINSLQANNLENLLILKRVKRDNHNRNAIDMQDNFTHYDFFLHISRENWEKAKLYYKTSNNNYEKFKSQFYNMINNFWKDSRMLDSGMWTIAKTTFDNFEYINQIYNSLKNGHGLRIKIVQDGRLWNVSSQCEECSSNSYEKYKNFNYYNEKIKLLGIGDGYRGEIGLDTLNNKIWFLGNETWFHEYFVNKNYIKITIKDQNYQIIKEIIINGNESMKNIINKYNLENGIYYQNDYIIDIWSAEPWRAKYYENNNWKYITENKNTNNLHENFKIKNNNFIKFNDLYDVITNTQLGSLNDNNDQTIINAVKEKNNNLDVNQVIVKNKENNSSWIHVKNNQNVYKNWSWKKVYFIIRQPINEVITNTQLGSLNDNNSSTILNAVKAKNPSLDTNEVNVSAISNTSADIDGYSHYNSDKYQGYQKVYFTIRHNLNDFIKNFNLNVINNSDGALLNELNYLKPNLDISQLEVINKTNTSVIIKAKYDSSKYLGEKKIYLSTNNQQSKIIDLDELIKKGIFLSFRDKNQGIIIKEIKIINTDNLRYSNVLITKNIEPIINESNENICSGKTILENNLPTEQRLKTSNCKYKIQEIKSFQITAGLSKTTGSQTNSEISSGSGGSSSSTNSSQTGHSQINSSSNSWEVSGSAGFSLFGFSIGGSGGGGGQTSSTSETNSLTSYSSNQEISESFSNSFSKSISLSNSFDLGNGKEIQSIKTFELELPFQELTVEGNQTIEVNTFLDKVLAQITLNLKQDIYDEINAKVITSNNEEENITLSIKEVMQKLQQYNLLPQEITINNDKNIVFNGKANLLYQTSTIGKTSIREIETF